jgi:drug/metabolite transporter (DMT)-like permease
MLFKNNWLILSIIASVFFVLGELIYKFTDCSKIEPELYVTFLFISSGIIGSLYYFSKKLYKKNIDKNTILKIFMIACILFVGHLIYWKGCKENSNPGLTRGVFAGIQILMLIMVSSLYFKKVINIQQIFGIICIVVGTLTISINNK